jgi:hypothetical protein
MSWIMKAKIVDIEQVSVYAATKEYMHFVKIRYNWEVVK